MKKRIPKKYLKVWIAFVNINAEEGYSFLDLVDSEGEPNENIIGAVAYIALIAPDIYGALDILHRGLHELHFRVETIFEIRNVYHLCECGELSENEEVEVDSLLKTKYVFKIIDRLWPYRNREGRFR